MAWNTAKILVYWELVGVHSVAKGKHLNFIVLHTTVEIHCNDEKRNEKLHLNSDADDKRFEWRS